MRLVYWLAASSIVFAAIPGRATGQVRCHLEREAGASFAGPCSRGDTVLRRLVLEAPSGTEPGVWRGLMISDPVFRGLQVFVDVRAGGGAAFEGWFALKELRMDRASLEFAYDPQEAGRATARDLDILLRARAYVVDSVHWSRVDNGDVPSVYCPTLGVARSLFCALRDADVAVEGEFYWGRHAVSEVRDAILRAATRTYPHALTGYNKDTAITLVDVQHVFDDAIERVRQQLRLAGP